VGTELSKTKRNHYFYLLSLQGNDNIQISSVINNLLIIIDKAGKTADVCDFFIFLTLHAKSGVFEIWD